MSHPRCSKIVCSAFLSIYMYVFEAINESINVNRELHIGMQPGGEVKVCLPVFGGEQYIG